ncbi:hypothetical protein [Microvirga aerophila]|uniref:Uncharacterized protein n=1 Tax=Microvirga aerophila TaxID=670291 RepID=A0A512BTN9_9HYPH|nr:hypothetical protein [Microvirga aerophila]GEO15265.1 hypothetical protein MAE02_29610 [Microvirga aerophila]
MTKVGRLSIVLAGCLLAGSLAGGASAQPRMDRDWDGGRDWRDGDRGWDRGRDRDWDRGPRWRGRDQDCYYERRREVNRFGDVVIRRYRVCED